MRTTMTKEVAILRHTENSMLGDAEEEGSQAKNLVCYVPTKGFETHSRYGTGCRGCRGGMSARAPDEGTCLIPLHLIKNGVQPILPDGLLRDAILSTWWFG